MPDEDAATRDNETTPVEPEAEPSDVAWSAAGIVAGLIVPGGGHLVLGDWWKGLLFAACLLVLFSHGLQLGGHGNFSPQAEERHFWMYNMQYALGGPALIARTNAPQQGEYFADQFADPAQFEIALLFTAVAGLLNLLILFDLVGLPLRMRQRKYDAAERKRANATGTSEPSATAATAAGAAATTPAQPEPAPASAPESGSEPDGGGAA